MIARSPALRPYQSHLASKQKNGRGSPLTVNPAQFGGTRERIARLPSGQLAVLPGGYGHLGIFHAELWADQLGSSLEHLPRN